MLRAIEGGGLKSGSRLADPATRGLCLLIQ